MPVGSSVGALVAPEMFHLRPSRTAALVLSGAGAPDPEQTAASRAERIRHFTEEGIAYRWRFTFDDFSPAFRATPLAQFFAELFKERDAFADAQSIIYQFEALGAPRPPTFYSSITCPTLVLTGTEDHAHPRALALKQHIPHCEVRILPGAGHACQLEQPELFDRFLVDSLRHHALLND